MLVDWLLIGALGGKVNLIGVVYNLLVLVGDIFLGECLVVELYSSNPMVVLLLELR